MIATIFLSVLILALFMGNAFLSLTDPKRLKAMAKQQEINGVETGLESRQYVQEELPIVQETMRPVQEAVQQKYDFSETGEITGTGQRALVVRSKYAGSLPVVKPMPLEEATQIERVEYLNKRITRLEQLLLKLNENGSISQKINTADFNQKLNSLSEFKQNTRLEMAALKQRLDKIKPVEKKSKPNISEISDKKLRDLVFRASN